ncbi:MAG: diphosphomevalonate decarboxylase [Lactobacillaceae bacterium]|jgi:diphosphomevalonate decarboxylase|nr:diphosphomevalonate decarboxylase [Lactobacillaceae bacterium]
MTKARAYTNIALIKYWGKRSTSAIIPYNNSISLTLDQFYTETSVTFTDQTLAQTADQFYFQNKWQAPTAKMSRVLDLIRQMAGFNRSAIIKSKNFVPTAAGLASSASAFAALAAAGSQAAGLTLTSRQLSILARHGSGSASRSILGGFVEWHAGTDDQSSYATNLLDPVPFPIAVIALVVNAAPKKVLSTVGMQHSVAHSPFYPAWVQAATASLAPMRAAIAAGDITQIGALAETNAMQMHATTLSADPPFTYFSPETLAIWQFVQEIRTKGLSCYLTLDAGPNPKLICARQDVDQIMTQLHQVLPNLAGTVCQPGPAVQIID